MKKIIARLRSRRRPPWSLVQLAAAFIFAASAAYAGMGQILASWPSPPYALGVNGIAFEGEYIWLKHNPCEFGGVFKCVKNGSVLNSISFPYHGYRQSYGLAFDSQYLWTMYRPPQGGRRDEYVKYTTTGSEVSFFVRYLTGRLNSASVSWDGQYLWSDDRVFNQQNPDAIKLTTNGTIVASFNMAAPWKTAAGYYNRQLWSGADNGYIYGMSILGASVVGSFPAPGGSCRAVGFDGDYLWTADANTPQYIYKVDIDVVDVAPGSFGKIKGIYR